MTDQNGHSCQVTHGPNYVPGQCVGQVELYRSSTGGLWWLCETDAERTLGRGIHIELVDDRASL